VGKRGFDHQPGLTTTGQKEKINELKSRKKPLRRERVFLLEPAPGKAGVPAKNYPRGPWRKKTGHQGGGLATIKTYRAKKNSIARQFYHKSRNGNQVEELSAKEIGLWVKKKGARFRSGGGGCNGEGKGAVLKATCRKWGEG